VHETSDSERGREGATTTSERRTPRLLYKRIAAPPSPTAQARPARSKRARTPPTRRHLFRRAAAPSTCAPARPAPVTATPRIPCRHHVRAGPRPLAHPGRRRPARLCSSAPPGAGRAPRHAGCWTRRCSIQRAGAVPAPGVFPMLGFNINHRRESS
jgi:hypothetical protein